MKQTKTVKIAGYTMYFKSETMGFTVHIKRVSDKSPYIGSFFTKLETAEKWAVNKVAQDLMGMPTTIAELERQDKLQTV